MCMVRSQLLLCQSNQGIILLINIQKLYESLSHQVIKSEFTSLKLINLAFGKEDAAVLEDEKRTYQSSRISIDNYLSKLFLFSLYYGYIHEFFDKSPSAHETNPSY